MSLYPVQVKAGSPPFQLKSDPLAQKVNLIVTRKQRWLLIEPNVHERAVGSRPPALETHWIRLGLSRNIENLLIKEEGTPDLQEASGTVGRGGRVRRFQKEASRPARSFNKNVLS